MTIGGLGDTLQMWLQAGLRISLHIDDPEASNPYRYLIVNPNRVGMSHFRINRNVATNWAAIPLGIAQTSGRAQYVGIWVRTLDGFVGGGRLKAPVSIARGREVIIPANDLTITLGGRG
jgi:hypothetical protein